jgi:hypothetical protein
MAVKRPTCNYLLSRKRPPAQTPATHQQTLPTVLCYLFPVHTALPLCHPFSSPTALPFSTYTHGLWLDDSHITQPVNQLSPQSPPPLCHRP